jgi:hypothetical protein
MSSSANLDINLHLKDIKYLFLDPDLDPFENEMLQLSGIEEAINRLGTKKRKRSKVRLNIFLPGRQNDPKLQNTTKEAMSKFCDFKIMHTQRLLEKEKMEGWRAVMIGLVFSAICLLMIVAIYLLGPLSDTILVIFVGFFTILIWMAIWNPAESFL